MAMDYGTAGSLRIDLSALVANYRTIAAQVAPAAVAGVVKADAYGLGAVPVSHALLDAGCRHFFVAHLGEAKALKPHLPADATLYILNGLRPGAEAECAAIGAVPVLNALVQLDAWAATARASGGTLPGVVQVDSGMSRLGLTPEELAILRAQPERLDGIDVQLVMTHLACADEPSSPVNADQRALFDQIAVQFPSVPRSIDNSGGAMAPDVRHGDIVRAGIALYGGAPHGPPNPMAAVVALDAYIMQLRQVPAGAGVGYGLTHHCDRPTQVATISVGYADGWPRHVSGRGSAYIGGLRVPVIGRVSMDSMALDVTDLPADLLYPGAPVELLGPHQRIDDVAAQAGTISYEILTRLGSRYDRTYLPAILESIEP
ncbi:MULTISPECIES: alanine racemase [Sphingobium]|uniref:Alanine racemase n=1 Tax=Sphingobium limneticum TaxID=1007511 RepID=A0A5J5I8I3_9SPHN|nr:MULTISPECIES: alanine racemase [Sphingobium]KAA9020185.1 alanine racemase [Sphingobium limneticum]KAA9021335.1 alanine racemase [Sphingobium limneticum]KAA9033697.1 alanine racemase [Sphingobium limneticum]